MVFKNHNALKKKKALLTISISVLLLSIIVNEGIQPSFATGTNGRIDHKTSFTPSQEVNDLVNLANSLGVNSNSLKNAQHLLNDNNPHNDNGAIGKLDAFIHTINANTNLTQAQKNLLISQANEIQTVIQGGNPPPGNPFLVVGSQSSNNIAVLIGDGAGSFGAATNFAAISLPLAVTLADFNGDGHSDIASTNYGSGNVSVLLGDGTGSFGAATNFAVGSLPQSIATADFNGDGNSDLVTGNSGSGTVSILLGDGTGSFGAATNFAVGAGEEQVTVGDFNGDGNPDLAVANSSSGNVSVLLGDGAGSFGAATNYAAGTFPDGIAVGDFNGDGNQDLAVSDATCGSCGTFDIFLGNGDGTFGAATSFAAGINTRSIAVGDFNGDGKQDLAETIHDGDNVAVFLGNGDGSFDSGTHYATALGARFVAIGDFNGDGKQDLVVATDFSSGNVSVLLGNGDGTFGAATSFPTGASSCFGTCSTSVAIGNFG